MSSVLAGVLCLVAMAIPVYLLYRYGSRAWYWHVLAVAVALGIGLMPGTALLQTTGGALLYDVVFIFLMIWGIGGPIVMLYRRLREKHA
ncbi:MAG: hypothetical protein ABSH44_03840 [Bryobacteraceae bacterium]|jgi:hypothetical protein